MDEYIVKLELDLNCNKSMPKISAGQFDKGRKFEITITADDKIFSAVDCTAILQGVRPDKSHFAIACTVDSNGKVIAEIDEETLLVRGLTIAKIVLSDSKKTYSTQMFIIDADDALLGNYKSDNSYAIFTNLIEQMYALNESGAIFVDNMFDDTSSTPLQNKIITNELRDLAKYGYFTSSKAQTVFDKLTRKYLVNKDYDKTGGERPLISIGIDDSWKNIAISVTNIKFSTLSDSATEEKATLRIRLAKGETINCGDYVANLTEDATSSDEFETDLSENPTAKYILFYPTQPLKDDPKGERSQFSCHIRITDVTSSQSVVEIDWTTVPELVKSKEDISNKLSTTQYVTNRDTNYPSLAYLDNYYYTQDNTDDLLDEKADKTSTLAGYSITDAYTKDETNYQISDLAQYGYFADSKAQAAFDKLTTQEVVKYLVNENYAASSAARPVIPVEITDEWKDKISISVTDISITGNEEAKLKIRLANDNGITKNEYITDLTQEAVVSYSCDLDLSAYPTAKYILFYPSKDLDTSTSEVKCHICITNSENNTTSLNGIKIDCTTVPELVEQTSVNTAKIKSLEDAATNIDTTSIEALNGKENIINTLNQLTMGHCESWQKTDSQEDILTLLHFTDIHNSANAKRIAEFIDEYSDYIDDAICTGDMLGSRFDESYDWWKTAGCSNIMVTLGNHDVFTENTYKDNVPAWNGATTYIVPQKMCYDKFIAPYASLWNITQPNDVNNVSSKHYGACYYYKDYKEYGVRLFALDCMHFSDEQAEWFETELDNARLLGYSVVCAYHYPLGKTDSIGTTWCVPRPYEKQTPTTARAVGIVSDFIDNGGEFVCWMSGHYHQDTVGVLTDDNRQLDINLDAASYAGITTESMPVVGTKSQDCFTIIGFDTTAKYIKMYRVGRDTNRYMQKHEVFCWDYANGKLIYDNNEDNVNDKINNALSSKADKATTLAGYNITDAYTKNDTDDLLDKKYDSSNVESGKGSFTYDESITTLKVNNYNYVKIGSICYLEFEISPTSDLTAESLKLTGLPFVSKSYIKHLCATTESHTAGRACIIASDTITIMAPVKTNARVYGSFFYRI